MPTYTYKARNAAGQLAEGALEGASAGAVADVLRGQGMTPVSILAAPGREAPKVASANVSLFRQKVSHIDLLLFSRQMHTLLKSGVPIMALFDLLGRSGDVTPPHRQHAEPA